MLAKELQKKKQLEENENIFREIMYSHCLRETDVSERKEVSSPQKTRRQNQTEVLRAWKNAARKRFKAADNSEKGNLWAIWHLLNNQSAMPSAEWVDSVETKEERVSQGKILCGQFKFPRRLSEQPRSGALMVGNEELENHPI